MNLFFLTFFALCSLLSGWLTGAPSTLPDRPAGLVFAVSAAGAAFPAQTEPLTATVTISLTVPQAVSVTGTVTPTVPVPAEPLPAPTAIKEILIDSLLNFQPVDFSRILFTRLFFTILVLAAGWALALLGYQITFRLLTRIHTGVRYFLARLAYFAVWVIAFLGVLGVFNVQVATVTAIVGAFGLALGLSSQDLLKNLIAGVYLLLEHPFDIGDQITVSTFTGRVAYIDLRTTKLITADGQEVIVPNTLVLSQVVVRNLPGTGPK